MTVWVVEKEGFHKIWGELDLFTDTKAVIAQVATALVKANAPLGPQQLTKKPKSSLKTLHGNLKKLQRTLKKANELMAEIMEGDSR